MRKIRGEEARRLAGMTLYFVPEPDITTYELAYIISRVGGPYGLTTGVLITQQQFQDIPVQVARHFKDTDDTRWKGDASAEANPAPGAEPQA